MSGVLVFRIFLIEWCGYRSHSTNPPNLSYTLYHFAQQIALCTLLLLHDRLLRASQQFHVQTCPATQAPSSRHIAMSIRSQCLSYPETLTVLHFSNAPSTVSPTFHSTNTVGSERPEMKVSYQMSLILLRHVPRLPDTHHTFDEQLRGEVLQWEMFGKFSRNRYAQSARISLF